MADYMALHQMKYEMNPVKDKHQQDMVKARKNRLKQNKLIQCCENK